MLPLHVGGDLDPRHAPQVDRHLHDCLVCFREFRELGAMRGRLGVLAELPLPAGILDGFAEEVMARIDVGEPGPAAEAPSPGPGQRILSFRRLSAAAAVMLVTLAGWRVLDDQGLMGRGGAQLELSELSDSVSSVLPSPQTQPILRSQAPALSFQRQPAPSDSRWISVGSAQNDIDGGASQTKDDQLRDLLETSWPLGVPVESEVQVILRSRAGVPGVTMHGQAGQATGLERDEQREPRQRKP